MNSTNSNSFRADLHAEMSLVIDATPDELYAIVSDYHVDHPAILPKPFFTNLEVLEGGQGEGTMIRFDAWE